MPERDEVMHALTDAFVGQGPVVGAARQGAADAVTVFLSQSDDTVERAISEWARKHRTRIAFRVVGRILPAA
jgi:hypothetical protein